MNKSRVIFYDDEPQTNKKLKQALIDAGYDVVSPATTAEALEEVTIQGAKLLVHCAHHTQTHWQIVDDVLKEHPRLPSIHIAVSQSAEEYQGRFKGLFHQKMRPLAPQVIFLRRVRRLIFMGEMQKENEHYKHLLNIHEKLEVLIDCPDLFEFKQKVTLLFMELFRPKNVLFFDAGEAQKFLSKDLNEAEIYAVNNLIAEEHKIIAGRYVSPHDVQAFLKMAARLMPVGWEKRKQKHFYFKQGASNFVVMPLWAPKGGQLLGHVFVVDPTKHSDPQAQPILESLQRTLSRYCEKVVNYMQVKDMSYIDDLTELYNQRYLKLALDKEINRAERAKSCFSVLFMDIDHFKRVNDIRGHLIGSKVLVHLARIIKENIRTMDYGFRYGGDEFIMILIGSDAENAKIVAERTRKQVEDSIFDIDGIQIKVTLSIGIASFPEHATTKEQILEMADQAMYVGKNKSRNIVFVAS